MNLLIVDDDPDFIEATVDAIDFQAIGIDRVFSASNAAKAKQVIQTTPVNIMVTDIEMPNGSGIDLLAWVRDQSIPIVTVFCTCYANFDYAQKAIELQSFSYYLKPIRFEDFKKVLESAVEEAKRIQKQADDHSQTALPDAQKPTHTQAFWKQVLMGDTAFAQALTQYPMLGYTREDRFILCFVEREDDALRLPAWKQFSSNAAEDEMFVKHSAYHKETILRADDADCYIFSSRYPDAVNELEASWKTIAAYCAQHLSMKIHVYAQMVKDTGMLRQSFEQLRKACADDVMRDQEFLLLPDMRTAPEGTAYHAPEIVQWEKWLTNRQGDLLLAQVETWIHSAVASRSMNAHVLQMLCSDVLQVVHVVLYRIQINAHALYADKEFEVMRKAALRSVKKTLPYLKHLIKTAIHAMELKAANTSGVSLIRSYIDTHLSENLTRVTLAEITYMNPDYMARLFRQDTGITLGAYILQRRMEQAKLLLVQTSDSVSSIALAVGYDNVSHFSKMFRMKVGCSPHKYRASAKN